MERFLRPKLHRKGPTGVKNNKAKGRGGRPAVQGEMTLVCSRQWDTGMGGSWRDFKVTINQ